MAVDAPRPLMVPDFALKLGGTRPDGDILQHVASITVATEPDAIDHATIVFANPFPDLPFTDGGAADVFVEGSALTISLGYVDAMQPVFDGEITSLSLSFPPGSGSPRFVVEAFNRLHRLTAPRRTETYHDVTDADIATEVASRNGLSADVPLDGPRHAVATQVNEDDFAFLRAIARALNYELRVEGSTLRFRPAALDQAPGLHLTWGAAQSNGPALTEVSLSLNPRRPVTRVRVRGRDPLSGEAIEATASQGDEEGASTGTPAASVVANAFGADRELLVVDRPVLSTDEAAMVARALFNELGQSLVEAAGTTEGNAALRAGTMIELDGVGRRFAGAYYVTRTVHRLGPDGYLTTFDARRGSVGSA
jgi:phage protein D